MPEMKGESNMTDSEKLDYLVNKFDWIAQEIITLKEDVGTLKQKMAVLEQQVANLRMYQENVLEPGLKRVAEGHLDLNRKLIEALKTSEEEEMLYLRVNVLECDMVRVKEKLALA
jgi:hypothetical protein